MFYREKGINLLIINIALPKFLFKDTASSFFKRKIFDEDHRRRYSKSLIFHNHFNKSNIFDWSESTLVSSQMVLCSFSSK